MSSISLQNISLSVYGESHGECVGAVLTGFPAGHKVDYDAIKADMDRRKPGGKLATKRKEDDDFDILSGVYNGYTTGAPICVQIKNTSHHSSDYDNLKFIPRPSHSDYSAYVKYKGFTDIRGGGHFSGRLTAPIVCVGSLCKQYLKYNNIDVSARVLKIGGVENTAAEGISEEIAELVAKTAKEGDSVGGKIGCKVSGVAAGIGGPLFDGIEGRLSPLLFGIPAVKAVEFGLGTGFANGCGSQMNDGYRVVDGRVRTVTNNNGGILGGITSGENIEFSVTLKPTPSIYKPQQSVDLKSMENTELVIRGRHDPCIVLRAVAVVEAVASIGILDITL